MLLFFSCWTISSQVSNGSSPIPNHSISSEETLSPPQKTSSSANGACGSLVLKKSQSSSGKPWKVPRSSVDHLSNAKKPQPFNAQIQLVPYTTIIQKLVHKRTLLRKASLMASHPQYQVSSSSFNTTNFLKRQLSLIPLPLIQMFQSLLPTVTVWADSSVNIAKRTFGVRNDYINIKKNTSWPTVLTTMQEKIQEVNILVVQSAKKNKQHEMNLLIPSFGTNIITNPDKMTKSHYRLQRDLKCKNKS